MALVKLKHTYIPREKFNSGVSVDGVKDGVNTVFSTPVSFNLDIDYFSLYRNGQLQELGTQYVILSSNGVGVGIRLFRPPRPNDLITLDFIEI